MSQRMTRTPQQPGASNWETPSGQPVQFYEQRYTGSGGQEWIFAPDAGPMYVTLFFIGADNGSAFLEGTDEAVTDITGETQPMGNLANLALFGNKHRYPLTDTVTNTTRVKVEGCTAVRANVIGGTVDITVRV